MVDISGCLFHCLEYSNIESPSKQHDTIEKSTNLVQSVNHSFVSKALKAHNIAMENGEGSTGNPAEKGRTPLPQNDSGI